MSIASPMLLLGNLKGITWILGFSAGLGRRFLQNGLFQPGLSNFMLVAGKTAYLQSNPSLKSAKE